LMDKIRASLLMRSLWQGAATRPGNKTATKFKELTTH